MVGFFSVSVFFGHGPEARQLRAGVSLDPSTLGGLIGKKERRALGEARAVGVGTCSDHCQFFFLCCSWRLCGSSLQFCFDVCVGGVPFWQWIQRLGSGSEFPQIPISLLTDLCRGQEEVASESSRGLWACSAGHLRSQHAALAQL